MTIPRSKGGLCYGVLDRCTLDKGKAVWSVALGPSVGKNVPKRWLGKILAGAAGKRDTLGELAVVNQMTGEKLPWK